MRSWGVSVFISRWGEAQDEERQQRTGWGRHPIQQSLVLSIFYASFHAVRWTAKGPASRQAHLISLHVRGTGREGVELRYMSPVLLGVTRPDDALR